MNVVAAIHRGARLGGIGGVMALIASVTSWTAAPDPIEASERPNILVIVTDDQDLASLPVMRNLMSSPGGSWINFRNAFTNQSLCCPARATLLTGQYAHVTGVTTNESGANLDDTNTLPVWLNDAGYRTGLFGKYLNDFPWDRGATYRPPGWDRFESIKANAGVITQRAVSFLNVASTDPFFLYLGYREPHKPALKKVLPQYVNTPVPVLPRPPNFNEADVADKPVWVQALPTIRPKKAQQLFRERDNAERALLGVDDGIQQIVDTLVATGALDDTIVVFISDNGYSWGSHRRDGKNCPYDECSRIPLLIHLPGASSNRVEDRYVSNVDVAPTLAEYAGVTPGLEPNGHSLIPLLTEQPVEWSESILLERRSPDPADPVNLWGVRVPGWMYAEYDTGERELYDMTADPYQLDSVHGRSEYADVEAWLAAELARLRPPP